MHASVTFKCTGHWTVRLMIYDTICHVMSPSFSVYPGYFTLSISSMQTPQEDCWVHTPLKKLSGNTLWLDNSWSHKILLNGFDSVFLHGMLLFKVLPPGLLSSFILRHCMVFNRSSRISVYSFIYVGLIKKLNYIWILILLLRQNL